MKIFIFNVYFHLLALPSFQPQSGFGFIQPRVSPIAAIGAFSKCSDQNCNILRMIISINFNANLHRDILARLCRQGRVRTFTQFNCV